MSKTKRLLSVTLASVMLFASAFSALAEDTATVEPLVGKIAAGEVTVELADTEVTEVTVPVTITFENKQTSPHGMFDISAEGATLKSATLKSFDNDNADPDAPDEKVIYIDTEGVNAEKGRVIVEAATDDLKKPLTSEVKIDVVLGFATALKAGRVITVTIDNIQATNLSEAPWTGMKAVNGTITVKDAEPECDHANAEYELVNVTDTAFEYTATCPDCSAPLTKNINIAEEAYTGTIGLNRSIDPQNDISILYYFNKVAVDAANVTDLVLVVEKETYAYDATESTVTSIYYTDYQSGAFTGVQNERYFFKVSDIAAYEMNNAVNSKLYGLNAEGEMVLLKTMNPYSIYTYAKGQFGYSDDLDKLLIDMLNYGAAAQTYAHRNIGNLVNENAEVTAELLAKGTQSYPTKKSECFEWTNTATSYPTEGWTKTEVGNSRSLILSEKVDLVYAITRIKSGTEMSDYYCSSTYYDIKGNLVETPYVVQYDGYEYLGYDAFVFNQAPLAVLDYPVTSTVYYGDPANGGVPVMQFQFSVETYIARNIESTDANLVKLMQTMYAYGHTLGDYCGTASGSEVFGG